MEFNNAIIVAPSCDLHLRDNVSIDFNTKAIFEMMTFSVDLTLHPIEFYALARLFGKSCISVVGIKCNDRKDITDTRMAELISKYATEDRVIGQYEISGSICLSGSNMVNLCSHKPKILFDTENGKLLSADDIVTRVLLPLIYYEVNQILSSRNLPFTTVKLRAHSVMDVPTYRVEINDSSSVVLRCMDKYGAVSFSEPNLKEQVSKFKENRGKNESIMCDVCAAHNGESIMLIVRMPLIEYFYMYITAPVGLTVVDVDDFWSKKEWNRKDMFDEDVLNTMYLMPSDVQFTCVIKVTLGAALELVDSYLPWAKNYFRDTLTTILRRLNLYV